MTGAVISVGGPLARDPALLRYWNNLRAQRAAVDEALLGTADIAVIYTAASGSSATDESAGGHQDRANQDSTDHA